MRSIAVLLIAVSSLALASCAHTPKKGAPPAPDGQEPAAPPTVEKPDDGIQRVDGNIIPPKKKGFFNRFAKRVGADNGVQAGPCPTVRILYDAARFVELDGGESYSNVGFTGEMQNVEASCTYSGDAPINMTLQIDYAIGKGPTAVGNTKDVKYWVSVVRTDIAPLSKNEFVNRVTIPNGTDRVRLKTPVINVSIPRADKETSGSNFEVIVGFDLTQSQLDFNRDGKRFKVNAGSK